MTNMMQQLFDGMSAQWALERSKTMMTLGEMITAISAVDSNLSVVIELPNGERVVPTHLISYRGYYSDLAIEYGKDTMTVGEFGDMLKNAVGETFTGYKGGDFTMSKITPMWVDHYGCASGIVVLDIVVEENKCVIKTIQEDE